MKKIIKTVCYCEYCKKHGLSASAMTVHERKCMSNPDNNRACLDCIYLEETKIPYTVEYQRGVDSFDYKDKESTGFKCLKLDKLIYHVKAELNKLPGKWPETFEDQEPMPKECVHQLRNMEYWEEWGFGW